MPYVHIEQVHERRGEKVAFMLTAENMAGLLAGAVPLYLVTEVVPFWLRVLLLFLGGTLGVLATLEIGGLTPVARLTVFARGMVRRRLHGSRITPAFLPGVAPVTTHVRALPLDGPVQALHTRPHATSAGRPDILSVSENDHATVEPVQLPD